MLRALGTPQAVPDRQQASAAIMRSIGLHRRSAPHGRAFLCGACSVAWTGSEVNCPYCKSPASQEQPSFTAAAALLLGRLTLLPGPRAAAPHDSSDAAGDSTAPPVDSASQLVATLPGHLGLHTWNKDLRAAEDELPEDSGAEARRDLARRLGVPQPGPVLQLPK